MPQIGSHRPDRSLYPLALVVGCVAAFVACTPTPPEHPTWAGDIQPFMAARCVRCHRSPPTVDPQIQQPGRTRVPLTRLDVCSVASQEAGLIVNQVTRPDPEARMPPAPYAATSDYDVEMLKRWARDGAPCGTAGLDAASDQGTGG